LAAIATVALSAIVAAATTIVVTPTNEQGWSRAETTADASVTFVADAAAPGGEGALQLTTSASTSSRAQYLHRTNTELADITELSYYTKQVAGPPAVADPAYQLVTCLNGVTATGCALNALLPGDPTGGVTSFATLNFEPYQNGAIVSNTWQYWDVDAGLFWSTRTVRCSGGLIVQRVLYPYTTIQTMCPEAVVFQFGVNVGTFNPAYVVRTDLFNFNGTTYDFELTNEPGDKDDCKDGGWMTLTDDQNESFKNQGQCIKHSKGSGGGE